LDNKFLDADGLQMDEAIKVVTNCDSAVRDLSSFVNKSAELNRLIAVHPNASASILSEVIEYHDSELGHRDEEAQRIAIRHPNISPDDALRFASRFPEDLFLNPSIDVILAEDPCLFEGNYDLLQARGCPLAVLQKVANEGTRAEQVSITNNPSLPLDLKDRLTPDYFYQHDLDALKAIASRQEDPVMRDCVNMYSKVSRPFCVPMFLPFDRASSHHRLEDQVFCGFPFTSAEFPWPVEKLGNYMQPIAQINLAKASTLLGVNLGSGLMQVWGGIDSGTKVELQTRHIPEHALAQDLDWFYPQQTPWLDKTYNFEGCVHSCLEPTDFPTFSVDCCRVDWRLMGRMFYPSIDTRVFTPHADDRLDHGLSGNRDDISCQLEAMEEELDTACISRHSSFGEAWGVKPLVFLGGYPQALGNAWAAYPGNMLFYHTIDYAVMMTVGVTYHIDTDSKASFAVNWTCDK
jgi:hypothetical protein